MLAPDGVRFLTEAMLPGKTLRHDGIDYDAQVGDWLQKEPEASWLSNLLKLGIKQGDSVLDCGSGGGKYSRLLSRAGLRVTGFDQNRRAVALSQSNNGRIGRFVQARLGSLPFMERCFDIALMRYVVHHLDPAEWTRVFMDLRRVLEEDGAIAIETAFHSDLLKHFDNQLFPPLKKIVLEAFPDRDSLVAILGACGFHVEREIPLVRKAGQTTTIDGALQNSQRLVHHGRGPTTWIRLSPNERRDFHEIRCRELPMLFPSGRVPREWGGTLLLARAT